LSLPSSWATEINPCLPVAHAQDLLQEKLGLDPNLNAHRFIEAKVVFECLLLPVLVSPLFSDSPQEGAIEIRAHISDEGNLRGFLCANRLRNARGCLFQ
jgi:hypothetical protein